MSQGLLFAFGDFVEWTTVTFCVCICWIQIQHGEFVRKIFDPVIGVRLGFCLMFGLIVFSCGQLLAAMVCLASSLSLTDHQRSNRMP